MLYFTSSGIVRLDALDLKPNGAKSCKFSELVYCYSRHIV